MDRLTGSRCAASCAARLRYPQPRLTGKSARRSDVRRAFVARSLRRRIIQLTQTDVGDHSPIFLDRGSRPGARARSRAERFRDHSSGATSASRGWRLADVGTAAAAARDRLLGHRDGCARGSGDRLPQVPRPVDAEVIRGLRSLTAAAVAPCDSGRSRAPSSPPSR